MMSELVMKELYDKSNVNSLNTGVKKRRTFQFFSKIISFVYYLQLKQISKSVDYNLYLEKNKEVCNGKIVIKGTRIQPITITNYFLANSEKYKEDTSLFLKDIKESYPTLDENQILVSLLYCTTKMKKKKILSE